MKNIKKLFLVAVLAVLSAATAWADPDVTYNFSSFTSAQNVTLKADNNNLTITLAKNNGSNNPAWASNQARVYAKGSLTVASASRKISKIVYTYVINKNKNGVAPTIEGVTGKTNEGTWDLNSKTWEGDDKEVTFSTSGTAGNIGFTKLEIYYATYTLTYSATNGSISGVSGSKTVENGASIAEGTTVILTAQPDQGYSFTGWNLSGTGSSLSSNVTNPTTFTMGTMNATVTASFEASGSSTLVDSDLAISNATVALSFDLYNNKSAQIVTYSTSSTGAITITPATPTSYFSYVHNTESKTITVTPLAVTPSAQTITVFQAADETYAAGSKSFTVKIADSTPIQLSAPTLIATPSNNTITLTWEAVNNASGYTIQYADNAAFNDVTTINNATSPNAISGLTNGTTYYFKAMSVGDGVSYSSSNYSEAISAVPNNTVKITITQDNLTDFTNSYNWYDWSAGNVSGRAYAYKNNGMQFNSGKTAYWIYNSDEIPGTISSVKIIKASGTDRSWTLRAGESAISSTDEGTQIGEAKTVGEEGASWDVTGSYSFFCLIVSGGATVIGSIEITYIPSTDPSISADNVELAYDDKQGTISYEVKNPVTGGSVAATTPADWITLGTPSANAVSFTCKANSATTERSATVTLTYTYNTNETVTKDVTITQAAAPYSTITSIFNAATSTATEVHITFVDWVVSGVSTNGKNVFVTDGTNGFVIYSSSDQSGTYSVGNILTGSDITCNLKLNNGYAQITDLDASGLTITTDGSVTAANIGMANLSGVNTGALVHYENLLCSTDNNKYYLSDGATTIQLYNSLYAFTNPTAGKRYNVTGIYQQYSETKEILPRSAGDLIEYVSPTPTIDLASYSLSVPSQESSSTISISYANLTIDDESDFGIQFYDSNNEEIDAPNWIEAEISKIGNGYAVSYSIAENSGDERSAYLKVFAMRDEDFVYSGLVTITQTQYVPDYADLPFEFDGKKSDINNKLGLTSENLGTDYANSPYLKFENKNNNISSLTLKFNETPGILSFDIKGNSFSGGTFKVQTSTNGSSFEDLKSYTDDNLGGTTNTSNESFNLKQDVRYVRWIYSEKSSGNVALGNIRLGQITPATIDVKVVKNEGRYWATFYNSDASYDLPTGAEAFILDATSKNLYRLGNGQVAPKATAVIIVATSATSINEGYQITLTKKESNPDIELPTGVTNYLQGYPRTKVNIEGKPFVLAFPAEGSLGFYQFTGEIIPAMKAYYTVNN